MWPLLALSLFAVALSVQRSVFWIRTNGNGRNRWLDSVATRLRKRDAAGVHAMCSKDASVYALVADRLVDLESGDADAAAIELVESLRPRIERGAVALSTVITAAPLLGILGTVTGIIQSFNLLGQLDAGAVTDPSAVAGGIAQALLTTAFGLIIAVIALFPYAFIRASANRCFSAIEALVAAAHQGRVASAKPVSAGG